MKYLYTSGFIITLLFCASCATGYHASGWEGGWRVSQLDTNVWRVTYKGNARSAPERIQDFALLRASELTLGHGFTYFAVASSWDGGQHITFSTPGYATTTGSAVGHIGAFGNVSLTGSSTTTYNPGSTFEAFRPVTRLIIVAYSSKPAEPFTFNASFLRNSLKEQYRLK